MSNFWNHLEQPFFALAPMEAVTDVIFRHVVAAAAPPDVWFTEFTNATGWVHAGERATGGRLVKTDDERPIVAQIWGGEPGDMEQLAVHCRELGFDGIDINMGCPAKSAVKSGGSALIRQPELAIASIAAAKSTGLPVSVKTRLGYSRIDEWPEWLSTLLRQDIANLTIHLRTKKEMSKVPAHHELISDIVALRDQISPHTLLTINGDIESRAHGEQLAMDNPGVNGVMIGRGVFHDPFAFAKGGTGGWEIGNGDLRNNSGDQTSAVTQPSPPEGSAFPAERGQDNEGLPAKRVARGGAAPISSRASSEREIGADRATDPAASDLRAEDAEGTASNDGSGDQSTLLDLLLLHLDLYDKWHSQTGRPYETLKRFYKIYIRDFDGASAVRDQLMHTHSTDEARSVIQTIT